MRCRRGWYEVIGVGSGLVVVATGRRDRLCTMLRLALCCAIATAAAVAASIGALG
jgi:hypothetical protein